MREAAERRQQLELEHEQALAVLNAKQQEIDLLQKVRELRLQQQQGVGHSCVSCMCRGSKSFLLNTGAIHTVQKRNESQLKDSIINRNSSPNRLRHSPLSTFSLLALPELST